MLICRKTTKNIGIGDHSDIAISIHHSRFAEIPHHHHELGAELLRVGLELCDAERRSAELSLAQSSQFSHRHIDIAATNKFKR